MISAGEGRFEITMADRRDIAGWLLLVEQVVPLFGPMPGLEDILEHMTAQKQAYCARVSDSDAPVIGGILRNYVANATKVEMAKHLSL